jgi:3D (Asp-Asp-Asp) domain-containing protein
MKRFVLIICLIIVVLAIPLLLLSRGQAHKLRLLGRLLFNSLDQVRQDYASRSCSQFSAQELTSGQFDALVTGYCKPQAGDFANRSDFLCAVALNCSCPNGRDETAGCALGQSFVWSPCKEFDDKTIEYCHQTASQTKPQAGTLAADWSCFPKNSLININGHDYQVTDKGSAIKGRRFDIWFDNCQDAFQVMGIYKIAIPNYVTKN